MNHPAPSRLSRSALLGLALLAVLPFLNGLTGDFTYDDKLIIRDNSRLASPSKVGEVFTTHYFGGSLATGTAYRPLVLLSYAVERWVFGERVFWFHAVNVLLHAGATALFAAWLLALGFPRGPSLAAAALFAVHTIHVEAVTGLVGRAEVLAAALVFAAALLWLEATDDDSPRTRTESLGLYVLCLLVFLAAVFVKENAVVVPGVVGLGEVVRRRWGKLLSWSFAGLFLPVGVLFAVRRLVLKGFLISKDAGIFDLENPLVALTPGVRAANAAALLFRYVAKTIVPVGLSADHSAYALPMASRLSEPRAVVPLVALAAAAVVAVALFRIRPFAAFGAVLFFGTFLPTSNLVFPIGTIYAERLMYLPSAGLVCLFVGVFAGPVWEVPRPSRLPWREALLVSAVLAYGVGTALRNRAFRDDATLFRDMVEKMPGSAKAHYNVAFDLSRRGKPLEAKPHLETAVRIFPRYYDAWASLGKIAWDEGRVADAVELYRKSVRILPHYENGLWGLAKTLEAAERLDEAAKAFDDGAREFPESYPIAYHRAAFQEARGRLEEAQAEWARAARVGGEAAMPRVFRARLLAKLGREEEAWREARLALAADANLVAARLFLADRYALVGKTLGASGELARAVRGVPSDPEPAARLLELARAHPETRGRAILLVDSIRRRFGDVPSDERLRAALAGWP